MTDPLDTARQYRDVFEVYAPGRKVLEMLERRFCSAKAVVTTGGIDAVLTTYQRAAHREVLDYIHAQIAAANRVGEPPVETPEANT